MLTVSCFKFIFCYSHVCVFLVGVFLYDGGLVNNSFFQPLAIMGERRFLPAEAKFGVVFCRASFDGTVDNLLNIIHQLSLSFIVFLLIIL